MVNLSKIFDGPYQGPAAATAVGAGTSVLFVAARDYNVGQYIPGFVSDIFSRYSPISSDTIAKAANTIGTYTGLTSISYLGLSSIIGVSVGVKTAATYAFEGYTKQPSKNWTEKLTNVGVYSFGSALAVAAGTAAGIYVGGVALPTAATLALAYPLAHLLVKIAVVAFSSLGEQLAACKKNVLDRCPTIFSKANDVKKESTPKGVGDLGGESSN